MFLSFWSISPLALGANPISISNMPFFWLKFFLESRISSESLEPFIGLLAYLDPKLWLKNQNKKIESDYGYAWPDPIQLKGSVCHLNSLEWISSVCHLNSAKIGSDYGYAWPDPIQLKGSVCHLNSVDLVD